LYKFKIKKATNLGDGLSFILVIDHFARFSLFDESAHQSQYIDRDRDKSPPMNRIKAHIPDLGGRMDLRFSIVDNAVDFMVALMAEKGKLNIRAHLVPSSPHYAMLLQYASKLESKIKTMGIVQYYRVQEYDFAKQKFHLYLGIKTSVPVGDTQAVRDIVVADTLTSTERSAQLAAILLERQFFPQSLIKPILVSIPHERVRDYAINLYLQYTNERLLKSITHTRYQTLCTSLVALAMGLQAHDDLLQTFDMWTTQIERHSTKLLMASPLIWSINASNIVKAAKEEEEELKPSPLPRPIPPDTLDILREPRKTPAAAAPLIGFDLNVTLTLKLPKTLLTRTFQTVFNDEEIMNLITNSSTTNALDSQILAAVLNKNPSLLMQLRELVQAQSEYVLDINVQLRGTRTEYATVDINRQRKLNVILTRLVLLKRLGSLPTLPAEPGKPAQTFQIDRANLVFSLLVQTVTYMAMDIDLDPLEFSITPERLSPEGIAFMANFAADDTNLVIERIQDVLQKDPTFITIFSSDIQQELKKLDPRAASPTPIPERAAKKTKRSEEAELSQEDREERRAKRARIDESVADNMDVESSTDDNMASSLAASPQIGPTITPMAPNISSSSSSSPAHVLNRAAALSKSLVVRYNKETNTIKRIIGGNEVAPINQMATNILTLRTLFDSLSSAAVLPKAPIFRYFNQQYLDTLITGTNTAILDEKLLFQDHVFQPNSSIGDSGHLDYYSKYERANIHAQNQSVSYNFLTYKLLSGDLAATSGSNKLDRDIRDIIVGSIGDKFDVAKQSTLSTADKASLRAMLSKKIYSKETPLYPTGSPDTDTLLIDTILLSDTQHSNSMLQLIHNEAAFLPIVEALAPPWLYKYIEECYLIYHKMQANLQHLQVGIFNSITHNSRAAETNNTNTNLTQYFQLFIDTMNDIGGRPNVSATESAFGKAALLKLFSTFLRMSGPQDGKLFADDGEVINGSRVVSVRHLGLAFFMEIIREEMMFTEAQLSAGLAAKADTLRDDTEAIDDLVTNFEEAHTKAIGMNIHNPEKMAIVKAMADTYRQYLIDNTAKRSAELHRDQSAPRVSTFSRIDATASFYFYCYQSGKPDGTILSRLVNVCDEVILKSAFHFYQSNAEELPNANTDTNTKNLFVWSKWPKEDYHIIHKIISTAACEYGARNELLHFPGVEVAWNRGSDNIALITAIKWTGLDLNLQTKLAILSYYLDRYFVVDGKNPNSKSENIPNYSGSPSRREQSLHAYAEKSLKLLMIQFLPLQSESSTDSANTYPGNPLLFKYFVNKVLSNSQIVAYCSSEILEDLSKMLLEDSGGDDSNNDDDDDDGNNGSNGSNGSNVKKRRPRGFRIIPPPIPAKYTFAKSTTKFTVESGRKFKAQHPWITLNETADKVRRDFADTIMELEARKAYLEENRNKQAGTRVSINIVDGVMPGNRSRPTSQNIKQLVSLNQIDELIAYCYTTAPGIVKFIEDIIETRERPGSLYDSIFKTEKTVKKGRRAGKRVQKLEDKTIKVMQAVIELLVKRLVKLNADARTAGTSFEEPEPTEYFYTNEKAVHFIQKGEIIRLNNRAQIQELLVNYRHILQIITDNKYNSFTPLNSKIDRQ